MINSKLNYIVGEWVGGGSEMMARAEELGALLAREEGKPRAEGKGEVYRAGQFFTYYATETARQMGDAANTVRDSIEIDVRREALGGVAFNLPRNFPTATPASAVALVEIIARQDIPKRLVSLVMGLKSALAVLGDADLLWGDQRLERPTEGYDMSPGVFVGHTAGTDYHVPFGGRADSSYGPHEQGNTEAEFYTIVKTSYISSGRPS